MKTVKVVLKCWHWSFSLNIRGMVIDQTVLLLTLHVSYTICFCICCLTTSFMTFTCFSSTLTIKFLSQELSTWIRLEIALLPLISVLHCIVSTLSEHALTQPFIPTPFGMCISDLCYNWVEVVGTILCWSKMWVSGGHTIRSWHFVKGLQTPHLAV